MYGLQVDALMNDILLILRLQDYDDTNFRNVGLKVIKRHYWYLRPELANLAHFSKLLYFNEKAHLTRTVYSQIGSHLLKRFPNCVIDLSVSHTFFQTASIDDSFLVYTLQYLPYSIFFEKTRVI